MRKIVLLLVLIISITNAKAQYSIRDSTISFPMIGATFSYELPAGILAERFGNSFSAGAVFQWKLKSNWLIGIDANFIFSEDVKENHFLDQYKTPDGNIIDGGGSFSIVNLSERGSRYVLKVGKIFSVIGPNKNSGILATAGVGFLQHRIYIDTPGNPIPYLEGENAKGYDRLTNGLMINQFIGYMNFSNKRLVNFYTGLEFTEGFTQNRRAYNFDTGLHDSTKRTDIMIGVRFGWVFPIYKRIADKYYIN